MIKKTKMDGFKDNRGELMWTSIKLLDFNFKYLTIGTLKTSYVRGGHYHKRIEEKLMCISGELIFNLDDESILLEPGDIVDIPTNKVHTIRNIKKELATFIEFKSEEFDESDPDTYKQDTTD